MLQKPLPGNRAAAFVFQDFGPADGDAGWSSPVARQAHNLKVAGSNPAPATNSSRLIEPVGPISISFQLVRPRPAVAFPCVPQGNVLGCASRHRPCAAGSGCQGSQRARRERSVCGPGPRNIAPTCRGVACGQCCDRPEYGRPEGSRSRSLGDRRGGLLRLITPWLSLPLERLGLPRSGRRSAGPPRTPRYFRQASTCSSES